MAEGVIDPGFGPNYAYYSSQKEIAGNTRQVIHFLALNPYGDLSVSGEVVLPEDYGTTNLYLAGRDTFRIVFKQHDILIDLKDLQNPQLLAARNGVLPRDKRAAIRARRRYLRQQVVGKHIFRYQYSNVRLDDGYYSAHMFQRTTEGEKQPSAFHIIGSATKRCEFPQWPVTSPGSWPTPLEIDVDDTRISGEFRAMVRFLRKQIIPGRRYTKGASIYGDLYSTPASYDKAGMIFKHPSLRRKIDKMIRELPKNIRHFSWQGEAPYGLLFANKRILGELPTSFYDNIADRFDFLTPEAHFSGFKSGSIVNAKLAINPDGSLGFNGDCNLVFKLDEMPDYDKRTILFGLARNPRMRLVPHPIRYLKQPSANDSDISFLLQVGETMQEIATCESDISRIVKTDKGMFLWDGGERRAGLTMDFEASENFWQNVIRWDSRDQKYSIFYIKEGNEEAGKVVLWLLDRVNWQLHELGILERLSGI